MQIKSVREPNEKAKYSTKTNAFWSNNSDCNKCNILNNTDQWTVWKKDNTINVKIGNNKNMAYFYSSKKVFVFFTKINLLYAILTYYISYKINRTRSIIGSMK